MSKKMISIVSLLLLFLAPMGFLLALECALSFAYWEAPVFTMLDVRFGLILGVPVVFVFFKDFWKDWNDE